MRVAGIIFSNLNDNTLSRLTSDRTVAAIPFGCRYKLVDFALSNMVNSGIVNISVVANYNYRTLAEHIGSGKDWDLARRSGGIHMISPYSSAKTSQTSMYSHRLEALKSMYEYIREFQEEVVVLSDCTDVCNIDLKDIVSKHLENDADITIVTTPCGRDFTAKAPLLMLSSDENGHVKNVAKSSKYLPEIPERAINIYVMKTTYLVKMLDDAFAYNYTSMSDDILLHHPEKKKYYTYRYDGYVVPVSSFLDYFQNSIALTENTEGMRQLLMNGERSVLTRVHNSAPCVYRDGASVHKSLIADDCIIEGTVENSVIFRGVKISKGAVVKNCVLFAGTYVGAGAHLNCVVSDINVTVSDGITLSGSKNLPFYISRDRTVS